MELIITLFVLFMVLMSICFLIALIATEIALLNQCFYYLYRYISLAKKIRYNNKFNPMILKSALITGITTVVFALLIIYSPIFLGVLMMKADIPIISEILNIFGWVWNKTAANILLITGFITVTCYLYSLLTIKYQKRILA